jgi:hypothetical protein
MNLITNSSSLSKIKPEYQILLNDLKTRVESKFGDDMKAYYLLGSVGRGEEILNISDIDTEIILKRDVSPEDEIWSEEVKKELEPLYPLLSRIDLGLMHEKAFESSRTDSLKFIFKTDGVLISGTDIASNFTSLPPGEELARLLNQNYREMLAEIQKIISEPEEEDKDNPQHIADCVGWISKKTLRLCLGIVMFHEPFYTRSFNEMAEKFTTLYPDYWIQAMKALQQYQQPTSDVKEAASFCQVLSQTIYKLADKKFGE